MANDVDLAKLIEDAKSVLERCDQLTSKVPMYSGLDARMNNMTRGLRSCITTLDYVMERLPKVLKVHEAAKDVIASVAKHNAGDASVEDFVASKVGVKVDRPDLAG